MQSYSIPLVPGPVAVPAHIREVYQREYGSSDLEPEFFELYARCEAALQTLLATQNQIAILSGEGMVALWGAMKSVLRPGDRVLAVANGVFGYGFAEMAQQLGATVETVGFGYDEAVDEDRVRAAAQRFRPRLVTMVHCETPGGILNPLAGVGEICREVDALFYVDFVASAGGTPVLVDGWNIDLGLLGSQKVLSLAPDLSMVSISARAWDAIHATRYVGYDALLPWQTALAKRYMPFTHNWQAMAGLEVALNGLLAEGLEAVYTRHAQVAAAWRAALRAIGIEIWPQSDTIAAPTVTAAKVPAGWNWPDFDRALRAQGMAVGGNYGPLAGKVFRIGHMGAQATPVLLQQGMAVLTEVVSQVSVR